MDESTQKHYVCLGDCSGVAQKPGVCTMKGCTREGEPLTECTCDTGLHEAVRGEHTSTQEIQL